MTAPGLGAQQNSGIPAVPRETPNLGDVASKTIPRAPVVYSKRTRLYL